MLEFLAGFFLFGFICGIFLRFIFWPIFRYLVILALVNKELIKSENYESSFRYITSLINSEGLTQGHKYPIAEEIFKPSPEGDIQYYRIQNDYGKIQDVPADLFYED